MFEGNLYTRSGADAHSPFTDLEEDDRAEEDEHEDRGSGSSMGDAVAASGQCGAPCPWFAPIQRSARWQELYGKSFHGCMMIVQHTRVHSEGMWCAAQFDPLCGDY